MKGRLLAVGRCAKVYEWKEDQVVKVFHPQFSDDAQVEFRKHQALREMPIPMPNAESIQEVDGRRAIVFQRVDGASMLENMLTHPLTMTEMARRLGELHAQIHSCSCASLPLQVDSLRHKIERADIDARVRAKAVSCLLQLPQEDTLCHGDFHPGNVMVSEPSPMVIDWVTAVQGNPMADIVWTRLLLTLDNLPEQTPNRSALHAARRQLDEAYWNGYCALRPLEDDALRPWIFPVAVARLGDGLDSERAQLLGIIRQHERDV